MVVVIPQRQAFIVSFFWFSLVLVATVRADGYPNLLHVEIQDPDEQLFRKLLFNHSRLHDHETRRGWKGRALHIGKELFLLLLLLLLLLFVFSI